MNTASIINHGGSTSLLPESIEDKGKRFPFVFNAITPEEKSWTYRLLPYGPESMTDADLIRMFKEGRPVLRADWEEQIGHPIGLITIYGPPQGGSSEPRKARYERGPELELDYTPPGHKPPVEPDRNTPAPINHGVEGLESEGGEIDDDGGIEPPGGFDMSF